MKNKNSIILLTLIAILLLVNACMNVQYSPSPNVKPTPMFKPKSVSFDLSSRLDLKLMLTDFYTPNSGQKTGYGYYTYLVFTNNSPSTRSKRLKASEAFVCSFSSVTEEDVDAFPIENTALFLAPLRSINDIETMLRNHVPSDLSASYSYIEGQLFQNKLAGIKDFDSIALLGSRTMLNPRKDGPFPDEVEVLDLSDFSPHEIKETIIGLRKIVLDDHDGSLPNFAPLKSPRFEIVLASFFESVGNGAARLLTIQNATADQRECL